MDKVLVNGEPVGETTGSTGVRWENTPNRHAYCDGEIGRLRERVARLVTDGNQLRERVARVEDALDSAERTITDYRGLTGELQAERDDYAARLRAVDKSWAALAVERDDLRALAAEILGKFNQLGGGYGTAHVSGEQLADWRERAGITADAAQDGTP